MPKRAAFILLSRASVVDFEALMEAVHSGHIVAASDALPEPLPRNHPVRKLHGFLHSAHRAGALDIAFKRMGDMVLEDMELIDRAACRPCVANARNERRSHACALSRWTGTKPAPQPATPLRASNSAWARLANRGLRSVLSKPR